MQSEVNLRHWLLLVYGADGLVKLVDVVRTMTSSIPVHVQTLDGNVRATCTLEYDKGKHSKLTDCGLSRMRLRLMM